MNLLQKTIVGRIEEIDGLVNEFSVGKLVRATQSYTYVLGTNPQVVYHVRILFYLNGDGSGQ